MDNSEMHPRYAQLLHELIVEYIASAQPVGSQRLHEITKLDVSPATIRNMLRNLELEGYIEQPHTSAGRIPSDKGYRWYINRLIMRDLNERRLQTLAKQYKSLQATGDGSVRSAAKLLSSLAKTLAASGHINSRDIYEIGMSQLFNQPEGEDMKTVREVSSIADTLDQYMQDFAEESRDKVTVFVGEENPTYKAQHTSVLARCVTLPDGQEVMLLLLGPKRMPYARHVPLLEAMATIMGADT